MIDIPSRLEGEKINLPENFYFHVKEAEPFLHIQIPIQLVKEKPFSSLTDSAKILYGLLLNRVSLSRKNGWLDEQGRIYIIYPIREIMFDMGVSKRTAIRYLSQLTNIDNTGYGLISKKQKMPTSNESSTEHFSPNLIYVHNFVSVLEALYATGKWKQEDDETVENTDLSIENSDWHSVGVKIDTCRVPEVTLPGAKIDTIRVPEMTPSECQNWHPIYNYSSNNYSSNNYPPTQSSQNGGGVGKVDDNQEENSLFLDLDAGTLYSVKHLVECMPDDDIRKLLTYPHFREKATEFQLTQAEQKDRAIEELRYLISYDYLKSLHPASMGQIDSILEIMTDIIVFQEKVTLGGTVYEPEVMGRQFYRLNHFHIEYVIEEFEKMAERNEVKIPRKLYIKLLMNAPSQLNVDMSAKVAYDMAHWHGNHT